MDETLHVYENEVTDWVVTISEEEARKLLLDFFKSDEYEDLEYTQCPDDQDLTITNDDTGKETHTCAEWCKMNGKGFLCSTEW